MDQKKNLTFVLLGDGECYEGSIWEAAMFAGHHRLNNLIAIIDRNQQCVTDFTEDCNRLEPLVDKWTSFGWEVKSLDGHSFDELLNALKTIRSRTAPRPLAVIANTVKGKGVSFMEKKLAWHHSVPTGDELIKARQELGG
jgi:transketolase